MYEGDAVFHRWLETFVRRRRCSCNVEGDSWGRETTESLVGGASWLNRTIKVSAGWHLQWMRVSTPSTPFNVSNISFELLFFCSRSSLPECVSSSSLQGLLSLIVSPLFLALVLSVSLSESVHLLCLCLNLSVSVCQSLSVSAFVSLFYIKFPSFHVFSLPFGLTKREREKEGESSLRQHKDETERYHFLNSFFSNRLITMDICFQNIRVYITEDR